MQSSKHVSEVRRLIEDGEGHKVEFKDAPASLPPEKVAREIVAFANGQGGTILLGVNNDGEVLGIERANMQEWLMDTVIGQHMEPHITPTYKEVELDGKKVAVLDVPMGAAKPYAVCSDSQQDYYLRAGSLSRYTDRLELARLFQAGGLLFVEKMPIHGSSIEDMDMRRLQDYFINVLGEDAVDDWEQTLLNRDLLIEREWQTGAPYCSYAGYILFAKDPKRRLPQAGIRLLVYPGNEDDCDASLDESLSIPFVGLEEKNEKKFIERSLPNLVLHYLQPHISKEKLVGMQRSRHWDYPVPVIRELLINAFAHRDWTKQQDVRITVFKDRMEINSPGALVDGMTIEKIIAGQQTARNANIISILRDYEFMDKGRGIRRQVLPLMKEYNNTEPEFEATERSFKVTLHRK